MLQIYNSIVFYIMVISDVLQVVKMPLVSSVERIRKTKFIMVAPVFLSIPLKYF